MGQTFQTIGDLYQAVQGDQLPYTSSGAQLQISWAVATLRRREPKQFADDAVITAEILEQIYRQLCDSGRDSKQAVLNVIAAIFSETGNATEEALQFIERLRPTSWSTH